MNQRLQEIYDTLLGSFGPQNWWPAETPFEVIIGTILTQNTNWTNVEKAINQLRTARALEIETVNSLPRNRLEELIRPSGYFRQKASRLQSFTRFIGNDFGGDLDTLFALSDESLRRTLLEQPGIGPETADSIILYAAGKPSFVVDAYTRRILERIGIQPEGSGYEQTRLLFMKALPRDSRLFNEYHALLVRLAKDFCRKNGPACNSCPLLLQCNYGTAAVRD